MANILIADEDRAGRAVIANMLAQTPGLDLSGVDIFQAASQLEALQLVETTGPGVVVIGAAGDGADALALCKAIRETVSGRSIKLAVVGARRPDPEIAGELSRVVAARFFAKPFELEKLTSFVSSALGRDTTGTATGTATSTATGTATELDSRGRLEARRGARPLGELADRRLPAVLLDILEARETGVLELTRGKVHKKIELSVGHPVTVSSNAREETLGQFLRGQGVISAEHHVEAIRRSAAEKRRIGEVLIELGAITGVQLLEALAAQVRFKIVRSLRWPDGLWRFDRLDRIGPSAGTPIDVVDLILRGLRETARLSPLPPHLRALRGSPLALSDRGMRLRQAVARVFGDDVARAFVASSTAESLIDQGFARDTVYGLIDALWLCDGLSVDETAPVAVRAGDGSESFSITELSAQSRRARTEGPQLYDILFGDSLDDREDSLTLEMPAPRPPTPRPSQTATTPAPAAPPQKLLEAYIKIQGASHYDAVGVHPTASRDELAAAIERAEDEARRDGLLSPELGDQPLARAIREALAAARATLLDDQARAAYDKTLERARRDGTAGGIDAEVAYDQAREAIRRKQWAEAIRDLHVAVERAPDEATYRAELGWCHYLKGNRAPRAADLARPHLNQALAIDPDHPAAHEYKGVISADLGTDEVEALFHLQRALDAAPDRASALETFEQLLERRGEHRRLERQYRRMIQRVAGSHLELDLWLRMARLYRNKLDDPESARIAFEAAAQLAPDDPEIEALISDLESGRGGRFHAESAELYRRWSESPHDPEPGKRLLAMARDASMVDRAFVAASNLIAIGEGDKRATELYSRYRPRFVVRAQRAFDASIWQSLVVDADSPEISALLALLAPAVHRLVPVTLGELEVSAADRVADEDLPAALVDVRAYVSHMLGVPRPPVFVRADLDQQIHIGGVDPPILLVGSELLSTPERLELAFRLSRAMSYLLPGRTLGGSHPAGVLKRFVLAAYYAAHAELEPPAELAPIVSAVRELPDARQISARADELGASHPNLNLSEWRHALGRTADRVGVLLGGDVPAAVRFATDTAGTEAATDLLAFTCSPVFPELRRALGLSIDV